MVPPQLRGKLEENPADPQLLMNEPGVGYRIADDPARIRPTDR